MWIHLKYTIWLKLKANNNSMLISFATLFVTHIFEDFTCFIFVWFQCIFTMKKKTSDSWCKSQLLCDTLYIALKWHWLTMFAWNNTTTVASAKLIYKFRFFFLEYEIHGICMSFTLFNAYFARVTACINQNCTLVYVNVNDWTKCKSVYQNNATELVHMHEETTF